VPEADPVEVTELDDVGIGKGLRETIPETRGVGLVDEGAACTVKVPSKISPRHAWEIRISPGGGFAAALAALLQDLDANPGKTGAREPRALAAPKEQSRILPHERAAVVDA